MTAGGLVVLTDRHQLPAGRDLLATVARCVDAGARVVVLRELDLPEPERARLAASLRTRVRVVSARTALPGACGVHLAAGQPAPAAGGLPHGRSCHDVAEVRRAVAEQAGWVSISPVAPSRSKPGHGPPLGVDGVRRAVEAAAGVPVLALGGVEASSVPDLCAAGARGVAVMGSVMRAEDPARVVTRLLTALEGR